jgi:hypothetical protein
VVEWPADNGVIQTQLSLPNSDDTIVLLDPDQRPTGIEDWHPFHNLVRVAPSGDIRWRAELVPQETAWKCYYAATWRGESLIAYAPSYECQLDPESGHLLAALFTK